MVNWSDQSKRDPRLDEVVESLKKALEIVDDMDVNLAGVHISMAIEALEKERE